MSSSAKPSILTSRTYLYMTEFFAGMAVMAVELGAARLLAPYFSSSQIVWTIIIGAIMIAMALGNYWGGRKADANPNPDLLYRNIIIAALWIAAIPVVGKYLIPAITGLFILAVDTNLLVCAAFTSCLILFVFPLFLLGTVTPSLAKYTVRSLQDSGATVGALNACNTVGSILGTFIPTFITIPALGTAISFLLFSSILLLLGLIYFVSEKRRLLFGSVSALLFLGCTLFGSSDSFAFWEKNLAYEGESMYNYLQVRDTPEETVLSTNVMFGVQSIRKKEQTLTGMYYDYALLGPVLANAAGKKDANMLILGMGAGTFASQCRQFFPNMHIEGVEIDERITDLAHRYFALDPSIPVTTYDGRAYLQAASQKYDIIMVDAYQDITIPFQMSSQEFFALVRSHLKDGGVMIVNMNMHSRDAGGIHEYLQDTIASQFSHVYTIDVPNTTNRELLATNDPSSLSALTARIQALPDRTLSQFLLQAAPHLSSYRGGSHILTDDKAPVEVLGMETLDRIMEREIAPYRRQLQQEGLSGLMQ
ncbi:fused MFS/spermidine synthase [uncultured Megasphaera sp.]|uniref:fused MFS/spermidine synthase n=1 Tax=uncultured Megasphaera sp. TaxID=165188 RepID=UPI002659BEEC|nr:fused MFS/spermidine synthase [uncultured Megasphaera sp.]